MKRVYLAAQYLRRDELREYKAELEKFGIEVTSRWLQEKSSLNTNMGDDPDTFYVETAKVDIEDIDRADSIVFFAESPLEGIKRGGRHFEHGYAYAHNKDQFIIGPKENIFHYLDGMAHFESFDDFKQFVKELVLIAEANG